MVEKEYKELSSYNLKDYKGKKVGIKFMCRSIEVKEYKNGNGEYMAIVMGDKGVNVDARVWWIDNNIVVGGLYKALVDVRGYEKAKDGISCIIEEIEGLDADTNKYINIDSKLKENVVKLRQLVDKLDGTIYSGICKELVLSNWDKYVIWVGGYKL